VWRFRLIRESATATVELLKDAYPRPDKRVLTQVQRIVRTTAEAKRLKKCMGIVPDLR